MPPINRRLARVGVARQAGGKGAAAATPTFGFGVTDGSILDVDWSDEPRGITSTSRFAESAVRESVGLAVAYESFATPKHLGMLIAAALGGLATTGGAPPYTHTITPDDTPDWLTFFGRMGADYLKLSDAQIDTLTLSWERDGDLRYEVEAMCAGFQWLAAPWTEATPEDTAAGVLSARGGMFTFDGAAAKIASGEIAYNNQLSPRELADAVLFDDLATGDVEATVSLTLQPDNLNEFRSALTGTAVGTTVAGTPKTGAFSFLFKVDANTDLAIAANNILYTADFPDADPSGGPAEVEVEAVVLKPAAGAEMTYTLRNAVAAY